MGIEIERKFLIEPALLPAPGETFRIAQGYLESDRLTVRVRIRDEEAFLTLKSNEPGIRRTEFEYPIPLKDAREMLDRFALAGVVEKERRIYRHAGRLWEVDIFSGENTGLALAEIELESPDEEVDLPDWVGREVSGDKRYFNAWLARKPFRTWPAGDAGAPRTEG